MKSGVGGDQVQTFSYPWSHWYANVVGLVLLLAIAIGILYQREHYLIRYGLLVVALTLTLDVVLITLLTYQHIRRVQEPSRITIRPDGLHIERIWGESLSIPWEAVISAEDLRPLLSQRGLRINTANGTTITIEADMNGFEQLRTKVKERIPSR
jgi:hypothetical protein